MGWPDHGLPKDSTPMEKMIDVARENVLTKTDEKIMVHCSAGVGRTGTLIGLVNLTGQCKGADKNTKISVFKTVRLMRERRMYMVERPVRFVLCG